MIAIIRRSKPPLNAANPTSNIIVNTWATPKVVSGVFFGCPASVRPITFSIVISFLFLDEPTTVTMTHKQQSCQGLRWIAQARISEARTEMQSDLAGNPFGGIANAAMQSVQIQWGWAVLVVGAVLIIAAAAVREDTASQGDVV